MKRSKLSTADIQGVTVCYPRISAELLKHRAGVGDLELARPFDVQLLHHAVVHQHREAVHPRAHAAPVQVELKAERLGPVGAAIGEEADLAERFLVAAPMRHDERV